LNFQAQKLVEHANKVQEKYKRNGKVVDKEIRDVLVERMREGIEISED